MRLVVFWLLTLILLSSCAQNAQNVQELSDKNSDYYYNIGMAALTGENYAKAIANFKMAILKYPDNYKAYEKLAIAYADVKDYKKAMNNINKALQIKPDFYEALLDKADILELSGDTNKAIDTLNSCIENDFCSLKPEAYYRLAGIYKANHNQNKYIRNLELAVMYDRNFDTAKFELAKAYVDMKLCKNESIKQKVFSLLQTENTYEPINIIKAKCYIQARDFEDAKKIIKDIMISESAKPPYKKEAIRLLRKILLQQTNTNTNGQNSISFPTK